MFPVIGAAGLGLTLGTAAHLSKDKNALNSAAPSNKIDITGDSGLLSHPEYQTIVDDLYKYQALQNGMTDREKAARKASEGIQDIIKTSYSDYIPSELGRSSWENLNTLAPVKPIDAKPTNTNVNVLPIPTPISIGTEEKFSTPNNNSLSWLNQLLPLLVAGGVGYMASRRKK